jgi:hypothetical protein
MRRHYLIWIAILATIGCSEDSQPPSASNAPPQDKRVKGTGLVDHISYSILDGLPHINVWPVKSTPLGALANLNLFSDFRPGMTFQDVAQRHGEPSETRILKNQAELRCYYGTNAILAVGREPLRSSSPAADSWTAWAFPSNVPLAVNAVANQRILNQLEIPSAPFCLVLRESTALEGSLWITVNSNAVTQVRWINHESTRVVRK